MRIATRLTRLEQEARRRPDEDLRIVIDGEDDIVLRGPAPTRRPATRPYPRT